jgi:tripartite-type tricarboxylate transporter receptor subunit TctC
MNLQHPRFVRPIARALLFCGATLCAVTASSVHAAFPEKPVTLIAHTAPGSSTDIFARELARAASPILGQPVVVVNRPGGSGATQMAALKAAAPDGYTIGVNTISHLTNMETNLRGVYSWSDFSWITLAQFDPYIWAVAANSPHKTLKDLVDYAKKNQGKKINVGGFGPVGSAHNIAFQLLAEQAGIEFNWVAYPGGAQAMTALLGGHIDVVNTNPGPAQQFAEAGRIRGLAVLDDQRVPDFPNVPTAAEAGFPLDSSWKQVRGVYGPKGVPTDVQKKLADVFLKAMKTPDFAEYMKNSGQQYGNMGPQQYTDYIQREVKLIQGWTDKLGLSKK